MNIGQRGSAINPGPKLVQRELAVRIWIGETRLILIRHLTVEILDFGEDFERQQELLRGLRHWPRQASIRQGRDRLELGATGLLSHRRVIVEPA